ncbi:MAG: homoserine kinase [Gammaproteobacteria bacterium]|nr:homoserine kinase [Gammaproteobacteria bacterium]
MAVYTQLSENEVSAFLQPFGLVRLTRLRGTDAGIENTNYFVDAEDAGGRAHTLVLTLFERGADGLPYFVALTTYLAEQGLPVPFPYRDQQHQAIHVVKQKPALLVPRFSGAHPVTPNVEQCRVIGNALALMHRASPGFSQRRDNDRGARWREVTTAKLVEKLPSDQRELLQQQVRNWQQDLPALAQLPAGITHGDLFHDNALFEDNRLTGIIDFYNACHDLFIYDLAVLVNDWCSTVDFTLDEPRLQAVLLGYEELRPLEPLEKQFWPRMLAYAALRFWLSRLESWYFPAADSAVKQKDPEPMRQLLLRRIG